MKNLRSLIDDEEKKTTLRKQSFDESEEIIIEQTNIEKIQEVKDNIKKSELNFPKIYMDQELLFTARKIYGAFILKLKSDQKITRSSLEDVLPEFISNVTELRVYDKEILDEIKDFVIDHLIGYGPISTIFRLAGDNLNDVIVNTHNYVDIIYKGKTLETPFIFGGEEELRKIIDRMLAENNRKIDEAHPIISSKLNDGSRVEVQIPPVAANDGSCVTIRKFQEVPLLLEHLIDTVQTDYKMAYF